MRLEGARLLLRQAVIYTDFWDWSPPLVFDALKIPADAGVFLEKCGLFLPLDLFMQVVIWLGVCFSIGLTACCDLPFAFLLFIVEVALILQKGTLRRFWSLEWLVF